MMNIEFQKYLMNALNEEIVKFKDAFEVNDNKKQILSIKNKDKYKSLLKSFQKDDDGKWYYLFNDEPYYVENKDLKKELDNLNKNKNSDKSDEKNTNQNDSSVMEYEEKDFENMGKAITYRTCLSAIQHGDFQEAVKDVLEKESDDNIAKLDNIEDMYNYAAAAATLRVYKTKDKKDQSKLDNINELENKLSDENGRDEAIEDIKSEYGGEFEKQYKKFEQAYKKGAEKQKKEMDNPDFEWVDPITGLKPEGIEQKLGKYGNKVMAGLKDMAKGWSNKIKNSPHNLENDMARLLVYTVQGAMIGFNLVKDLFFGGSSFKKEGAKKKKDKVKKAIDDFKKKFDEWKKKNNKPAEQQPQEGQAPQQNASFQMKLKAALLNEEEKQQEENSPEKEREQIVKDYTNLLYSEILPYLYYKLGLICDSFSHKNNKYILKDDGEGNWSTLNNASNKMTLIEDTKNLIVDVLLHFQKQLAEPMKEFAKDSAKDAFKKAPSDVLYQDKFSKELKTWLDNLQDDKIKNSLMLLTNSYNDKTFKKKEYFKTFNDWNNYLKDATASFKNVKGITPLVNVVLEFKNNDLPTATCVLSSKNNGNSENNDYENILNKLNDLDKIEDIKSTKTNMQELSADLSTAIEQLNDNPKVSNDLKSTYEEEKIEGDFFIDALYLKAALASMNESFIFNTSNILTEDNTNEDNTNKTEWFEKIKKWLNDVTPDNFKSFVDEYKKLTEEIDKAYEEETKKSEKYNGINANCAFEKVVYMNTSDESNDESENEVEKIKQNLPEEEAKKALDNMVVNVEDDKINVKTTFNGWKGEPDKLDVYIYSDKDIDQQIQAAASPFYQAYKEAYRDLFDKWCEETEKGTDENKKKAIPLLKKLLGDKDEDNIESNNELDPELKSKFDAIKKEVEALKDINKTDEAQDKLENIEELTNKTLEDIRTIIEKMEDGDKKTSYEEIINGLDKDLPKENLIKKLIYIKALMAKMALKESMSFNKVMNLLFEAENQEALNKSIQEYKTQLFELLNKDFTENDIKNRDNLYKTMAGNIKKAYDEMIKDNDKKKEELDNYTKDPMMLLFAMGDTENKNNNSLEAPEDVKKEINTADKMIVTLSDHLNDNNFMDLVGKVAEQNKKINDELSNYSKDHPEVADKFKELASQLGDFSNQTIPALWAKNKLLLAKDANESWYVKRMLKLLTEAEEQNDENKENEDKPEINFDELKKKSEFLLDNSLEELMKSADVNSFKNAYQKWIENIKNLIEEIKKANNEEVNKRLDELQKEDPLKLAAACVKAIEALEKAKEENNENPAEGGENNQNGQENGGENNQNSQENGGEKQEG